MDITGQYTPQGLSLATQLLEGEMLTVTRIVAGGGYT